MSGYLKASAAIVFGAILATLALGFVVQGQSGQAAPLSYAMQTYPIDFSPTSMAFDGTNLWVTGSQTSSVSIRRVTDGVEVMHLQLTDNAIGLARGIAYDSVRGNMWIAAQGRSVNAFRVSDGHPVLTLTLPFPYQPNDISADANLIWVSTGCNGSFPASFHGCIFGLRPSDGAEMITGTASSNPNQVLVAGGSLWVYNGWTGSVSVLRLTDGFRKLNIALPPNGPNGGVLEFDGTNVWAATWYGDNVAIIRASDGAVIRTVDVGSRPSGLAFDGTNMWITQNNDWNVGIYRKTDGTLLGTVPVGNSPGPIVFDGNAMWVGNSGDNTLTKISSGTVSSQTHLPIIGR